MKNILGHVAYLKLKYWGDVSFYPSGYDSSNLYDYYRPSCCYNTVITKIISVALLLYLDLRLALYILCFIASRIYRATRKALWW